MIQLPLRSRSSVGRRPGFLHALVVAAAAAALSLTPGFAAGQTPSPASSPPPSPFPEPPSAFGNYYVTHIAVSPAYAKTGLVLAVGTKFGCSVQEVEGGERCTFLWVSHDGGATWKRIEGPGWTEGSPVITVDKDGKEIVYNSGSKELQRSDDAGETWVSAGAAGFPAPSPNYAKDAVVAVASRPSYLLRGAAKTTAAGSGGELNEFEFMLAPGFPDGGAFSPGLLIGQDKKATNRLVVKRCTADLKCSGVATLANPTNFPLPLSLLASTAYAQDGVVFAQTTNSIYKSVDGGATFAPLVLGKAGAGNTAISALALAPGYKEQGPVRTVYASVLQTFSEAEKTHTEGGVYRSADGGATWATVGSPGVLDDGATTLAVAPDGRLFAGYIKLGSLSTARLGLVCSADNKTWRGACPAVGDSAKTSGSGSGSGSGGSGSGSGSGSSGGSGSGSGGSGSGSSPGAGGADTGGGGKQAKASNVFKSNPWVIPLVVLGGLLLTGVAVAAVRKRAAARSDGL